MEIQAIKSKLSIEQVLRHYGIKINRNGHVNCPFHEDKTPSMRVYKDTNTVYCFSGNCATHGKALDVIEVIQRKESCGKHQAIMKAKELLGYEKPQKQGLTLEKVYQSYQKGLSQTPRAQGYAQERGLDWAQLKLGYNSGQLHHRKPEAFIQELVKLKLLKPWSGGGYQPFGRGCLLFLLRNKQGQLVSLYGRSIKGAGHYYMPQRSGLYPHYLPQDTQRLILTESVIDAASILQMKKISKQYQVLALYGTNGLTKEHQAHLQSLKKLQEIVIMLDGDEAGHKASEQHQTTLSRLLPNTTIRMAQLPQNMDVNELWANHLDEKLFEELLEIEEKQAVQAPKTGLDTSNPYDLRYPGKAASYAIKGGLKTGALDSLKVTLVTTNKAGRSYRSKVDLYEDKTVEKYLAAASEKLGIEAVKMDIDLSILTDQLEQYRAERMPQIQGEQKKPFQISELERLAAKRFLEAPELLARLNEKIGQTGIVGEEKNRLLLLMVASSYKQANPLHALIQGSSSSGKTLLLRKVMNLIPKPSRHIWTRITDKSLYHAGKKYRHSAVAVEDWDGLSEEVQYVIRELQSGGILRSSTTEKRSDGQLVSREITAQGPISSLMCTTRGSVYEDNMSRCFLVAVDESRAQTERILAYQYRKDRGEVSQKAEGENSRHMQVLVECLKPVQIINPYAGKVELPKTAHKIRRLNALFQAFVQQIACWHQYQRKKDQQGRIIVEKSDLKAAIDLLFETLVLKVDELDGSLRTFFEWLKGYVKKKEEGLFTQREVRQGYRVSKTQMFRYLQQLLSLEYIAKQQVSRRNTFHYKLIYEDDQQALKARIQRDLATQLAQLA